MKTARFILIVLAWTLAFPVAETSGPEPLFLVIVSEDSPMTTITREDLAMIYLGKKTLWGEDARILPAMVRENDKAMKAFIEDTLHKTIHQYRAYWKRRLFSGGGMVPKTFKKSNNVVDYVTGHPGAIGIVKPDAPLKGVKTVEIFIK